MNSTDYGDYQFPPGNSRIQPSPEEIDRTKILALNERNLYLENELQAAYKRIHQLEKNYNESVLYHMEQQYRRDAEDQEAIDRYRGQD